MAFTEKPPILRGNAYEQLAALRDYLFRMAQSLETVANAEVANTAAYSVTKDGKRVYSKDADKAVQEVRSSAEELRSLIIKTAKDITVYVDKKVEEYDQLYVAQSEFGTFQETIQRTIVDTAAGVVDSYGYSSLIQDLQTELGAAQNYLTTIDGEIRRGIVWDPSKNQYVTGIAISQNLQFTGDVCRPGDANHPDTDNYTYYYLSGQQTFGLYASDGWQFWIKGAKVGWFDSVSGMLHVGNIVVEDALQIGTTWKIQAHDGVFELVYVGS